MYRGGDKVTRGEIRNLALELLALEEAENAGIRRCVGYKLLTIESI
jgi:hypothetical protein